MKTWVTLGAAVLLLLLGAVAASCKDGKGGGLSLEEYFQKLDSIQEQADATFATQEASTGEPSQDASGEELAAFLRDTVTSSADVLRDAAADVNDLEPPDEVADAHSDIVAAINDLVAAFDDMADSVPDTLTLAELENAGATFFNSDELNAANEQFLAACTALEQIASDNSITVDLACNEE